MDKDHIISEIKRTAGANGGQALVKRAFFSETGISKGDWYGRFWARFSDAVKEAGFNPKEFRDEKQYTDDDMLACYARLSQELGRLPSNGDLRLRKRRDFRFASGNTYDARFGSKLDLVRQLATYCSARPDSKDVFAWCQEYLMKNPESERDQDLGQEAEGYVYLIKTGRHFKIGRTNDVARRGGEIAIQLPEQATTIHVFRTDDPSGIEAYWHRRFAEKRRNGEWFELSGKDVAAFKRRKSFM